MRSKENRGDLAFRATTTLIGLSIIAIVSLLFYYLLSRSWLSMETFGFGFITGIRWDPVHNEFGALPFIFGTLVSSLFAIIIAVPISIGIAVFLSELAPTAISKPFSFLVELLAGIPSIVYGLWGLFVLVPWLQRDVEPFFVSNLGFIPLFGGPAYGVGILPATLILSIMIIPTISSVSRDTMKMVPISQREAAYALGATRAEAIGIVIKNSRSGIFAGVMLGLGRAIGETMAVTMVIGNRPEMFTSIFSPAYTLSSVIINEFVEASGALYISSLIEIALILFVITLLVNIMARGVLSRFKKKMGVSA